MGDCGLGANGSSSSGKSSSTSGFSLLPSQIQNSYKNYASTFNTLLGNSSSALTLNDAQQNAINQLTQGTAPTAQSIQSDIAMQTNPYDSSVIDEINRQSKGSSSQLNQAATAAGQLGSNRQMLGANDIDTTRLNQIGQFKQSQYNTALNNALTTLPQARATSAQNALSAATTGQLYPSQALSSYGQALSVLPTSGGSQSSSKESSVSGGVQI